MARKVSKFDKCIIVKRYVTGRLAGEVVRDTHPLNGGRVEFNHLCGMIGGEMGNHGARFVVENVERV